MMLGKEKMAKLRSIAKLHNLVAGSQTIPNSVAEIVAAQGTPPPIGPYTAAALPAPERKKLPPKKAKRKAPRVVSDEEADESTKDGLVCKRKMRAVIEPLAAEGAAPDYVENPPSASMPFESAWDVLASNASVAEDVPEQLADTQASSQASSQAATELPASPPRLETPLAIQPCEGGGENQPSPPPPTPALPAPLQEAWKSFTARLNAMVDECLPQIIGEGLKDSLNKFELDNCIDQKVASTARAETEKVKCDMMMQGSEFSRVENALKDELQSLHQDKAELRQKLHNKLQDAVELESKLVPMRERIAELEEARKTVEEKMAKLEKRLTERETLLGKVEADRDKASKELSETTAELARVREENNGFKKKVDELDLEIVQVREENSVFKTKIDELELGAAQVLTSGLGLLWSSLLANLPILTSPSFQCTTKWWMARSCLRLNCCSHLLLQLYHLETLVFDFFICNNFHSAQIVLIFMYIYGFQFYLLCDHLV